MKKALSIILALLMILSAFAFASCTEKDIDEDNNDTVEETAQAPSTEEKTNDSDGDDELFDEDSSQAKLVELGETDGYEITFKVTSVDGTETEYKTGRKGNTWWSVNSDNDGYGVVKNSDNNVALYSYDGETWTLSSNLVSDNIDDIISIYGITSSVYLFYANGYSDDLERIGNGKIAGRSCTEYEYKAAFLTVSASYKAFIDDELGITLKWETNVKADGERTGESMEVTSFVTGSGVKVPEFPDAGENYQDYTGALGWPDNSFTALIPKAPGTVSLSVVEDNTFSAATKDVTEKDFSDYVDALKDAGFDGEIEETLFDGTDSDGNNVSVQYAESQLIIKLTKAE